MDDKPVEQCPCCGGTGIRQPGKRGPKRVEIDLGQAKELAALGLPKSRIGQFFGIQPPQFYYRLRCNKHLRAAIEEGRKAGAIKWGGLLRERAAEGNGAAIAKMLEILREGGD